MDGQGWAIESCRQLEQAAGIGFANMKDGSDRFRALNEFCRDVAFYRV